MKKILGIIVLSLLLSGNAYADFNLSCASQSLSKRVEQTFDIERTELKPSHFTGIVEITSPGEVIIRFMGSSETGYEHSPYVGTINDIRILASHKLTKKDNRGIEFTLNLISGMFERNIYLSNNELWWMQWAGICKIIKK
jgi:hypothetical protein